jgi:hypothetical protein
MLMDSVRAGAKIITRVLYGGGGASAGKIKSGAMTCTFQRRGWKRRRARARSAMGENNNLSIQLPAHLSRQLS